jgi:topoisomerase IA-like protein
MEHMRSLLGSEPHNGLNMQRLSGLFGPLIFSKANPTTNPKQNFPNHHHHQQVLQQTRQIQFKKCWH